MIPWIVAITIYICAENLGVAALQVWLLEQRRPCPKGLAWLIFGWAALMSGLAILQACEPESWKAFMYHWLYFPMAVEMVWNLLMLVLLPAMVLIALCVRLFSPITVSQPQTQAGLSRRKFLYLVGYGAVPAVAIGMGVHGALTREDLRLREFNLPLAGLPPELEGFTIAHVSDLHSGLFVGPERLKRMSDMTNDLKADLVVVTGDLINREMTEFPPALAAIQRLESRYGLYLCEGNHDVIPGDGLVVAACAQNGLKMLFDSCVTLPIRGRRLVIAGLPWARPGYPGQDREIASLFPVREEGDVRILLAHHPHVFDVTDSADLLLSGHTHGGQIMLNDHIGLGLLRFKYCSGLFQRGNTTMIVNNGCGDWFPCRIGAPAEIGLLRLTKGQIV